MAPDLFCVTLALWKERGIMGKDATYTLRLDSRVKDALKTAAKRDRRTVSSLLEKLIYDYLTKEGFHLPENGEGQPQAKDPRKPAPSKRERAQSP
jgi:predicted transcriptional regulator